MRRGSRSGVIYARILIWIVSNATGYRPYMTSAVCGEGGNPEADKSDDKLAECDNDMGGGGLGGGPIIRKFCGRYM